MFSLVKRNLLKSYAVFEGRKKGRNDIVSHSLHLRSVHACVRGSRMPFHSKIEQSLDCKINAASADI